MKPDKKVQHLAKQLVGLIGELDQKVSNQLVAESQEASNKAFAEELVKNQKKTLMFKGHLSII